MNVELPEPKRSNVPWREVNRFSASPGYLYPSAVIEVLPTDRITGNLHTILRSRPTNQSIYGSFRESHQAFFVPARLYSKTLDQLSTFGNQADGFDPNTSVKLPFVGWRGLPADGVYGPKNGQVMPCSLLSYLNMFPSMFKMTDAFYESTDELGNYTFDAIPDLNVIPLVAYYDILRNYYFNSQELDMPFVTGEFDKLVSRDRDASFNLVSKFALDNFISNVYNGEYSVDSLDNGQIFNDLLDIGIPLMNTETDLNDAVDFSTFMSLYGRKGANAPDIANHAGLGVRCYDDDYFVVSLNQEYVDEINNSARVVVTNGSFSVTQIQRANRIYKHRSKNVLGGSDYDDYLYVHFNARLGREVNKPIFLGSTSSSFYFEDIYSTQAVGKYDETNITNNHLGSRAGILNSRSSSNDGFIDFTANEFGYLIVLSSIIPQVTYSRGIPKMYLKSSTDDFYSPEFDAWSFQDIHPVEIDAHTAISDSVPVTKSQPAWFEHLATYDKHHGLYDTDLMYGFQVLARDADYMDNSLQSTYIRPWEWNYIFSYQAAWFDNFEWQILLDLNLYRPISKQILPSM